MKVAKKVKKESELKGKKKARIGRKCLGHQKIRGSS